MNITGNTIFIPGGTSGIGLALALRLQAAGNTVIIGGRRTDELQRLAAQHGFATFTLDTTDAAYTPTYNGTKAFVHQYSESIRLQLAGTSVQVVELVPRAVRTKLMPGQSEVEQFLPVDVLTDQALALIERDPEATEILVEAVKFLRFSEAENRYAQTGAAINAPA